MTTSIKALRERRDALAIQLQDLVNETKNPTWNAALQEQYDTAMREIGDIDSAVKRNSDVLARIAAGTVTESELRNEYTREPGRQGEGNRALRAYLTGGIMALSETDRAALASRQSPDIRAAMSTTTGSEGGYTVAQEYFRQLTEAMQAYGGIRAEASIIQTGTGAQMNFPTTDATAETGELVGQNAAVATGETTFGTLSLDTYKFSSKKIAVPFELLQDAMFDIEAYINALLATRIGRITSTHFTTGTGSSQPRGVVTAASSGKVGATGQTATVTYDDLVDLEHSVDPAYRARPGVGWMMNDASVKVLRKLKDGQSRPLFVPGYEQGVPGGAPDMLMGRPICISQEMAKMAANAKPILFGDFKSYIIREVMDLTLFRMTDSAFTLNGQVGFVAFNRQGGNLIDVGGAVKFYQNSAT